MGFQDSNYWINNYSKTYLQPIPMDHWIYFALSLCLYNEFVIIRIAYLLYIDVPFHMATICVY